MDEFKERVLKFCKIDDELQTMSKRQKELKTHYKEMSDDIMEYMMTNKLEMCNAGDLGILTLQQSKSTASLKKEQIYESIVDVLNNKQTWNYSYNLYPLLES